MAGKQTRARKSETVAAPELTPATAQALFSAWDQNDVMTRINGIGRSVSPDKPAECQERARYWYGASGFVRSILQTRINFFDYGFKIKPVKKADEAVVTEWVQTNERVLTQYRQDAWQEFAVQDVAVCVWRENGRPLVFPVEQCTYTDTFGEEKLTIKHGLTETAISGMKGLTPAEKDALKKSPYLTLTKFNAAGQVFKFDVLKRARVGDGFGLPTMKSVFTTLAQMESMEVGDNLYAGLGRDVIMQLKIGHEIKNGPFAGNKIHFCTQAKADAAVKGLRGKKGVILLVTNFDQQFEFPRPDTKHFDAKKYEGVLKRLVLWGMPLAQIILERALNPNLMQVLKQQAIFDRAMMAGHLNTVLAGMNPPSPVRVSWSNRCFADSRLFADLLKFSYQSGAISQQTVRDDAGYDHDEELARKQTEAALPAGQKEPAYDPTHSKPGDKPPGKNPGTPDNP